MYIWGEIEIDIQDHRASLFMKHIDKFYLEPGTSVLMLRDSNKAPKLVVPYRMIGLVSLFNGISTFVGYLMSKPTVVVLFNP